ncbi:MAG: hypothetical protein KBB21_03150 [Nannocystaceae bacterium]|nr:hypothetical protein [Nannocystaceae bacterium]
MGSDAPTTTPTGAAISLSRWAGRHATWVLLAWLVALAVAGWSLAHRATIDGGALSLLPEAERPLADERLLMLTLREGGNTEVEPVLDDDDDDALVAAAAAVADRMVDERVPLVPPAGEAAAWFDAHAMWLVSDAALVTIGARLSDAAMSDAIEGLRARMSSPLFGVAGDEPRRDPLGLFALLGAEGAAFASHEGTGRASPTASGDLLAADGGALLLLLRSSRAPAALIADVRAALGDAPVDATWVGPTHVEEAAADLTERHRVRMLALALAGIAAVLAGILRRIRATLAILACLAALAAGALAWLPTADLWSAAMVVLLLGFVCEGALHLQRISARGWPAAVVLAGALLPLLLSPYPAWRAWAWYWAIAVAIAMVLLRVVLPAIHERVGGAVSWATRGFQWRAMPALALTLALAALAAGAWSVSSLRYRGADRLALGEAATSVAQRRLLDEFFDPATLVMVQSEGASLDEALERAASDERALAERVPTEVIRVDGPGAWIARTPDLDRRRTALAELKLPLRLDRLRATLEAQGFRPDAFGEFLRSAAGDGGLPTAAAMLQSALGPWLRRYASERDGRWRVRTFVQLGPDADAPLPRVRGADEVPLVLQGPAVAARRDREGFADWLGIWVLCQLWFGALTVWLGTRSLATAMAAAVATLATQCAVLWALAVLHVPVGPAMVPALLLVGAAATISSGRACRAIDLQRPLFATGVVVTSLCQIASGAALVASGVPVWQGLGIVVVLGAATASGFGLFLAPGVVRLLRGAFGRDRHRDEPPSEESPP